jgi:4-hydroxy-tetrahydrodipicolinate reductase
MRILLIGHGRMGQLIERLAPQHDCEIAGIVEVDAPIAQVMDTAGAIDMAIDFSQAEAVGQNLAMLAARHVNVVIGTTGWQAEEPALRAAAERARLGVLASANFALGMNIFRHLVEEAATQFSALADVGAWIHEAHHAAKKDAPSGTALMLQASMRAAGYDRAIDMSSTRAGALPGMHEVGFDSIGETVTLTHNVRDRSVFAHGALEAARWLNGRHGWFTMRDMIRTA